jgi:hypothetical protein
MKTTSRPCLGKTISVITESKFILRIGKMRSANLVLAVKAIYLYLNKHGFLGSYTSTTFTATLL